MNYHYQNGVYGYDYKEKTFYSPQHLGVDWNLNFEEPPMPKTSRIIDIYKKPEGGNTILFQPVGEMTIIRWLHLDKFYCGKGQVIHQGQKFVRTGNTGNVSPKPTPANPWAGRHLHEDIWPKGVVTLNIKDTINPRLYYKTNITNMKPTYIEQDGKVGFLFDFGQYSVIQWATDEEWGNELTDHFKPDSKVLKIVNK